jgi:glycosyltransferase involved in cell wall biosynthesis
MRDYTAVIPVHNGEKTIIGALQSIAEQSVVPRKIIVFDNASTDRTSEKVGEFAQFCEIPLEIIQSTELLTPNKSFEESISTVTGRFLWLAADDLLFPWAAEKLIKAECGKNCLHTVSGVPIFMKNNGTLQLGKQYPLDLNGVDFLNDPSDASLIYGMHTCEEIKGLFPSRYFPAWDWSLLYRCVNKGIHLYGPLPVSLRESTEIDTHRKKIEEEFGISRILPYLRLTRDILHKQSRLQNFQVLSCLIRLNLKGYFNFGTHHKIYENSKIWQKRISLKNRFRLGISRLSKNQLLINFYSRLPLATRIQVRGFLGYSSAILESPFTNLSVVINETEALNRNNFISLNSKISNLEFFPDSTFNTAQIVELIRFFYMNSVQGSQLKLNLSQITINEKYVNTIIKGFERLFSSRKIEFSHEDASLFEGIIEFYSLIWENEFMGDLRELFPYFSSVNAKEKSVVNLFLPEVPQPNRDAGSVDAIYLLAILKNLGVEINIFLQYLATPNPVALDLLRRFGEVRVVSDFVNSKGLNLIYGPYSYAGYEKYSLEMKFTYLMVDAVFRRFEQSEKDISDSDRKALNYERNALNNCELAFCISAADQRAVTEKFPHTPTEVYPIVRFPRLSYSDTQVQREWITFIGSLGHTPNRKAAEWIIKEFAPSLYSVNPEIKIVLAGIGTDSYNGVLANVIGLGVVSNLPKLYEKSFATIAPMEIAAGINGKVIESLCFGVTPIVSSAVGENLPSELIEHCKVAKSVDEYIERTILLSKKRIEVGLDKFGLESVNGNENLKILRILLGLKL